MDAKNVIKHGDENFQKSIKNLPESAWTNGFVTGTWTLKDVLAHIASYELILVDVLKKTLDPKAETPHVEKRISLENNVFNAEETKSRKDKSYQEILKEYTQASQQALDLIDKFSPEQLRQPGLLSWYKVDFSLDDYIVLRNYGHKRHHATQIKLFRQRRGNH